MNGNEFEKLEHEVETMLNGKDSVLDLEKTEKLLDAYVNNFKAAKEYLQSLPEVKLQQFFDARGIDAKVVAKVSGPRITRYEIEPGIGVSPKKIKKLKDELQMELQALSIRILAPIPGRAEVGIEIPNKNPQTVMLNDIFESEEWKNSYAVIPLAVGKNVAGEPESVSGLIQVNIPSKFCFQTASKSDSKKTL